MLILRKKHSGTFREYYSTFDLDSSIPSVKEVEESNLFVEHVTMNHRGLNWKIFRYSLNNSNYKSFIYAFAVASQRLDPSKVTIWQFESNARRLLNSLKRKHILLSESKKELLNLCTKFSQFRFYCNYLRKHDLDEIVSSLERLYF